MNDQTPTESRPADPAPFPRPGTLRPRRRWLRRVAHWFGELSTVFVGVYAAFLLSNHASHRQSRQRREQILLWVEERYTQVLDNAEAQLPKLRKIAGEFNAALAAGRMPPVKPISWVGDYDPSDSTSVLQSGGYDLLDIATVRDMRSVESTLRQLVGMAQHLQVRSDALILPNQGKDASVFYDPATLQLRESYAWFPNTFEVETESFEELEANTKKLLAQIRADRAHGR